MSITIEPASGRHDALVTALFNDLQIRIHPDYWQRCYDTACPVGLRSRPFVALDGEGAVVGFASVRTTVIETAREELHAQVLHDFLVAPGTLERDAAAALLGDLRPLAEITLCAGPGIEASRLLDQNHFALVGHFGRLVHEPRDKSAKKRGAAAPRRMAMEEVASFPGEVLKLNEALRHEERLFRRRTPEELDWLFLGPVKGYRVFAHPESGSYFVVRRERGRGGDELLVADLCCPMIEIPRLASALAELSDEEGLPMHLSVMGGEWVEALSRAGFRILRPRWPFYYQCADSRLRTMGNVMLRAEKWMFTAADGEVDRW